MFLNAALPLTADLTILQLLPHLGSSPAFHPAGGSLWGPVVCQRQAQRPHSDRRARTFMH